MSLIPYGRQFISQADIEAVTDVLKSDFLTQGRLFPTLKRFLPRPVMPMQRALPTLPPVLYTSLA